MKADEINLLSLRNNKNNFYAKLKGKIKREHWLKQIYHEAIFKEYKKKEMYV